MSTVAGVPLGSVPYPPCVVGFYSRESSPICANCYDRPTPISQAASQIPVVTVLGH